jgi:hypothetical protein
MRAYTRTVWLIAIVGLLIACNSTDKDTLETYYFPDNILNTKVYYEYRDSATKALSEYWSTELLEEEGQRFIVRNRYDAAGRKDMYIKEQVLADGMLAKEYIIYPYDSTGAIIKACSLSILQEVLYPFIELSSDSLAFRFEAKYALPPNLKLEIHLRRDRRLKGYTALDIAGQSKLNIAVFKEESYYQLTDTTQGGYWEEQTNALEYYGKGKGLVKRQELSEGVVVQTKILTKEYTEEAFKALFK